MCGFNKEFVFVIWNRFVKVWVPSLYVISWTDMMCMKYGHIATKIYEPSFFLNTWHRELSDKIKFINTDDTTAFSEQIPQMWLQRF